MSQVWFITGSSRGLGRHLAQAVLAAGHRLVATARKPEQLGDLVAQYGDRVRAVALDVTDPAAARAAAAAAVAAFGRIDVVVNNAGYGNVAAIEDVDAADFRAQIETNFHGVVHVTQAVLPILRAQGGGRILQVSSIGGRSGAPGLAAYQAAKWAVEGFSEVLAQEVTGLGIKVTLIEPGGFRTDWAGASMSIADISGPYRPTVGMLADHIRNRGGEERGDPDKAAQVILQLAELDEPPLRLLLGSDAVYLAAAVAAKQAAEDERWQHLSLSTDFDGQDDPAIALRMLLD